MAKLRLNLSHRDIIMKKIISVTIDDVEYIKDNYSKNNRVLQIFYNFIKRNKNYITFISYKDHSIDDYTNHMYLKNCELHSLNSQSFCRFLNDGSRFDYNLDFHIDGVKMNYETWKIKIRKYKLLNLKIQNDV